MPISTAAKCSLLRRSAGAAPALAALLAVCGCSSNSSSRPTVGAVTFANVNGTAQPSLKQLTIGESTYLDVDLTGDSEDLGANWSVYCGSALPPGTPLPPQQTQDQSCGTFTPAHTLSGPVPSYATTGSGYVTLYTAPTATPKQGLVTLYAASTQDPSRTASVTLLITSLSVSVQFAPAPPSSLDAGSSTKITAVVTNDAQNAGVTWSAICGAPDCGTFSPAQTASGVATTYTASTTGAGINVQITATSVTDPNKSISATLLNVGPSS